MSYSACIGGYKQEAVKQYAGYVQLLCGLMLLGSVKQEGLIIAYGCGANGKSTFFNAIREVMGDYADTIAADVFLSSTTRNVMPERAALRGKRLVLAEEMPNHALLSSSVVKQLCSRDHPKNCVNHQASVE